MERLPRERFVYLADSANFPYGEKDDTRLRNIVVETVGRFIRRTSPKLIVIACNTASVVALAELRRQYGIPFVGVVPAIKPAAEISRRNSIGLLATRRTVEDPYTDNLIRTYADKCEVSLYPGVDIVEYVENRLHTGSIEERRRVLQPTVDYFRSLRVDTLVVGCTHFIFVQDELADMMGNGTRVIDSIEGVGRQVLRLLGEPSVSKDGESSSGSVFYVTDDTLSAHYRSFPEEFALEWGGVL